MTPAYAERLEMERVHTFVQVELEKHWIIESLQTMHARSQLCNKEWSESSVHGVKLCAVAALVQSLLQATTGTWIIVNVARYNAPNPSLAKALIDTNAWIPQGQLWNALIHFFDHSEELQPSFLQAIHFIQRDFPEWTTLRIPKGYMLTPLPEGTRLKTLDKG